MSVKLRHGKMMVTMAAVVLAVFAGWMITPATAVTLTGETWTPSMTPPARLFGPEFIRGLEQATGGAVKSNWHTAGALGPAPELHTRLVTGVIDWGQFNAGYTPGVFPFTEMFEMPFRFPSAEMLTKAMIEIYNK